MNKAYKTIIEYLKKHKETETLESIVHETNIVDEKKVLRTLIRTIICCGYECYDILEILKKSTNIEDRMLAALLFSFDPEHLDMITETIDFFITHKQSGKMTSHLIHAIKNTM